VIRALRAAKGAHWILLAMLAWFSGAGSAGLAEAALPTDSTAVVSPNDSTVMLPDSLRAKGGKQFPSPDSLLVTELRKGGYVLVFRHAQTDWAQRDADLENFADRAAQRNLSAEGDSTAVEIGRSIRLLKIPIGQVLASPMWRCRDTATLAFGKCDTPITLFRRSPQDRAARVAYLSAPITDGTNLVLITHQDVLIPIIQGLRRDQLKEGEAFVVKPLGDGKFEVLAQVTPEDWKRLAATPAR
jgi:phosphohistidine phosphatase SixA